MKSIKDLKLKSYEGFEVKNLQRFPSSEWGDEGGLQADIYYNGKCIGRLFDAGDGGMCNFYSEIKDKDEKKEVEESLLRFIKRVDTDWQKYKFVKERIENNIVEDDDYETLVCFFEDKYNIVKAAQKEFKQGFNTFVYAELADGLHARTMKSQFSLNDKFINEKLSEKFPNDKYDRITIINKNVKLSYTMI